MRYIKQLDTIRAIAVILVVIEHWYYHYGWVKLIRPGGIGVDTFFVLSGFLISKILLDNRGQPGAIKNFYARRVLRIFPIYYIFIFGLFFFNSDLKQAFPWYLTYTQNIYYFLHGGLSGAGHLWTLAVEEQFYLLWPCIMLFINKRFLLPAIILFMVIGAVSQYFFQGMGTYLAFASFDSFGLGALLAWQITYGIGNYFKWLSVLAVAAFIFYLIDFINPWPFNPLRTELSIMALWIISYIVLYKDNLRFKFILNNRFLIFVGKVSYGIYLYHIATADILFSKVVNVYVNPLLPDFIKRHGGLIYLVENVIILLLVAWLSYVVIEKPFLRMKKYFKGNKKRPQL